MSFFGFSNLTCHLEDTGIGVFCFLFSVPPDSRQTEPGSSNQETFLSAGKYTRVVLVPCCIWKCGPTAISGGMDISKVSGIHDQSFLSEGHKN